MIRGRLLRSPLILAAALIVGGTSACWAQPDLVSTINLGQDLCPLGAGGGNGLVEPGETASNLILVTNNGDAPANNCVVTVTSLVPGITFSTATTPLLGPVIPGPEPVPGQDPIVYDVDLCFPCGTDIQLDIQVDCDEGTWNTPVNVPVPAGCLRCLDGPYPCVDVCGPIADTCPTLGPGHMNGEVDPGEDIDMGMSITNVGIIVNTNVNATISTLTPGVTITQNASAFGDIEPGLTSAGTPDFEYSVAETVACGTPIDFDIDITSGEVSRTDACTITIPPACNVCSLTSPDLSLVGCETASDTCSEGGAGNGDGEVDPGESVTMEIEVQNTGTGGATNVVATVSTATPGVFITQASTSFGDIGPGGTAVGTPTIDYTVDQTVACGTNIVFDVDITADEGSFSDSCTIVIPVNCNPCISTTPDLVVETCTTASDTCQFGGVGSGNGEVDPGESATMDLTLRNIGGGAANNVTATVSTATPGVTITQNATSFGTIASLASGTGTPTIDYDVADTVACGTSIVFDVDITADEGSFSGSCSIVIPVNCNPCTAAAPNLTLQFCTSETDTCQFGGFGNMNGNVDPGENITMSIGVENNGDAPATGVTATVTSSTLGVVITQGTTGFGDIAVGGSAVGTPTIDYDVALSVACGTDLVFDVEFSANEGTWTDSCTVTVPVNCTPCFPGGEPPDLTLAACNTVTDTCLTGGTGNNNGEVDPGEDVTMELLVENVGVGEATTISVSVTTSTPGVTITQGAATVPDLPPGGSAAATPTIDYSVDLSVACGTDIVFVVNINTDQGLWVDTCTIVIPVNCNPCQGEPDLSVASCGVADDNCQFGGPGAMNGEVDPGEDVTMDLEIQNTGPGPATNVTAIVSTTTPGVTVTQDTTTLGDIASGASAVGTPTIDFTVDDTVACDTDIVFDVDISSDQGAFADTCTLVIPVNCEPCVPRPDLSLTACNTDTDTCQFAGPGNRNGEVDPGEIIIMSLDIENTGLVDATSVSAIVSTATPGVSMIQGSTSFPDIPVGGAGSSGPPIIYSVDLTVACGTDIVFDVLLGATQGQWSDSCTIVVPVNCIPCSLPDLSLGECTTVDDSCALGGLGDQNGEVEPGESIMMELLVDNGGSGDATNVTATVTTTTTGVSVIQGTTSFGTIAAGGFGTGAETIDYTVGSSVACGSDILFDVSIQSDQQSVAEQCTISIPAPCNRCETPDLSLSQCNTADDSCSLGGPGDQNGEVDPGEDIAMELVLQNNSGTTASNVTATVTSSTPGITITQDTSSFGDLAGGGSAVGAPPIDYTVAPTRPCPSDIVFDVSIQSDQQTQSDQCTITIPMDCIRCSTCLTANLIAPQGQLGAKLPPDGARFEWSEDPNALEYHLNTVTDKTLLDPNNVDPNTPRQSPTGMGTTQCTAAVGPSPGCTDDDALTDPEPLLYYVPLSACGPDGTDEGPF